MSTPNSTPATLASVVKAARIKAKKTQVAVAAEAGVSAVFVSDLENERRLSAKPVTLVRLAKALKVSPRRLLKLSATRRMTEWDAALEKEAKAS